MKLSVVIPAHNEEGALAPTVEAIATALRRDDIPYEILVVDAPLPRPELARPRFARRSSLTAR